MLYLDETLPDHPKIVQAGHLIGGDEGLLIALGLFIKAIAYARHQVTDGLVPVPLFRHQMRRNGRHLSPLQALVKVGLLAPHPPHGYRIHDYHDWNPSAAQVKQARQLARERKQRQRDVSHQFSGGTPASVTPDVTPVSLQNLAGQPRTPDVHDPPSKIHHPPSTIQDPPSTIQKGEAAAAAAAAAPPRRAHARHVFCGRVCVPAALHADFLTLRNHAQADVELQAWYELVNETWTHGLKAQERVGTDVFAFWKARFDEQFGPPPGLRARPTIGAHNAAVLAAHRQKLER